MGTSKSYIPLTKGEHTKVKRAITSFINCKTENKEVALEKVVSNFGSAIKRELVTEERIIHSAQLIIEIFSKLPSLLNGEDNNQFNIGELTLKMSDFKDAHQLFEYIYENNSYFTIVDSLAKESLFECLDVFEIESFDELIKTDKNYFMIEFLTILSKKIFLQHYYEIIYEKNPDNAISISEEIGHYITNKISSRIKKDGLEKFINETSLNDYVKSLVNSILKILEE